MIIWKEDKMKHFSETFENYHKNIILGNRSLSLVRVIIYRKLCDSSANPLNWD